MCNYKKRGIIDVEMIKKEVYKQMKHYYAFIYTMVILLLSEGNIQAITTHTYEDPFSTYIGENGITIISYCSNWKSDLQLKTIYDELVKNIHGKEMDYLSTIYIYPGAASNYPKGFTSFYHEDYRINKNGQYIYGEDSYIEIYGADQYKDISQMSRILSHEYGHHFTFYYLMTKENLSKENWINSEYARIRGLKDYPQVTYLNQNTKTYSHEWDIAEILAEDYIQLFGSELAKKTRDYLDVKERLQVNNVDYYYVYSDFNLLPQENLDLLLASDVEGLQGYFSELTGIEPLKQPEKLEIRQPNLSAINNVHNNYNEYIWNWSQVKFLEIKNQYEYTIVINPLGDNDYPIPLKTTYSGEPLTAVAGSGVDLKKGIGIMDNFEGKYEIRVFVKDREGFMHSCLPLEVSIKPKDNSKIIFSDIPNDNWANDYIYDLTNRGLVEGYPDGTFHPEKTITRAEFMAFLIRTIQGTHLVDNKENPNWFVAQGYKDVAKSMGLLNAVNDNVLYYEANISREEMAQMIYIMLRHSGVKVNINFKTRLTDTQDSMSFMEISITNYYNIISGYPDQTFKPKNKATRAEAMKMISEYLTTIGS